MMNKKIIVFLFSLLMIFQINSSYACSQKKIKIYYVNFDIDTPFSISPSEFLKCFDVVDSVEISNKDDVKLLVRELSSKERIKCDNFDCRAMCTYIDGAKSFNFYISNFYILNGEDCFFITKNIIDFLVKYKIVSADYFM